MNGYVLLLIGFVTFVVGSAMSDDAIAGGGLGIQGVAMWALWSK